MAEPSAADLRRLKALERRIEKAAQDRKEWTAERRELRRQLSRVEKRAGETGKALENADQECRARVDALVAENKRLAEHLESALADRTELATAAEKLRAETDAARKQAEQADDKRREAETRLSQVSQELDRAQGRLKTALAQLEKGEQLELLPAEEVAHLVSGLVDRLRSGTGGLAVRDGELKLKVAFGGVGDLSGFLVPTPASADRLRGSVSELTLRFEGASGVR